MKDESALIDIMHLDFKSAFDKVPPANVAVMGEEDRSFYGSVSSQRTGSRGGEAKDSFCNEGK